METELYKKYRPTTLKAVKGQAAATSSLQAMLDSKRLPHTILFAGPSGCGKTTLARILITELNCSEIDSHELNCADFRGIDMVREIRATMTRAPLKGDSRVWIIDEAHQLSSAAQNAFLKILEDTPKHVYFFLVTTNPGKLLKTIRTRSTTITLKALSAKVLERLIISIARREQAELTEEVVNAIVKAADGSARQALVILHQILYLESEEDQLEAITHTKEEATAITVYKQLVNTRTKWPEVAKTLRELSDDPEGVRRLILACARNSLLRGGKTAPRAYIIITEFEDNFYDSGPAGLARACYAVVVGAK